MSNIFKYNNLHHHISKTSHQYHSLCVYVYGEIILIGNINIQTNMLCHDKWSNVVTTLIPPKDVFA
jgi:hypothetical protein